MHMIRLSLALILGGLLCQAQEPADLFEKAPPDVDRALRERISLFYQAHVDGKFRLADKVVAEDSKDIFFSADKPRYLGFEIIKIKYLDNFTKAQAVVACRGTRAIHGERNTMTLPLTSLWKIVDGEWFWYALTETEKQTPWGTMKAGPDGSAASVPGIPRNMAAAAADILRKIQVDKTAVMLSSYQPASEKITLSNAMAGAIKYRVQYTGYSGFSVKPAKGELQAGEKTELLFHSEPVKKGCCDALDTSAKPAVTATIIIEPTNQMIPIEVTFAIPPEIQKQIPK